MLGILALVNMYVFMWRDGGSLGDFDEMDATAIGAGGGPLPAVASPPDDACTGDPVRIFAELDDLIVLDSALSGGRTLRLALIELGVTGAQVDRLEAAIRPHMDLGALGGSGAAMRVAVDRHAGAQALEIELAEGRLLLGCRRGDGFEVRLIEHPMQADVVVVGLRLGRDADLLAAVEAADESPELASLIADALAFDVDFLTESRPGDEIQVMVEKRFLGRNFHRYGRVLGVRFIGSVARVAFFRYKPEGGQSGFYTREGRPMSRVLGRSPIAYHRVPHESRAMLPPSIELIGGRVGAVYRVGEGAPVVSVARGTIRRAERHPEAGFVIEIELADDGRVVRYSHLLRFIGEPEVGDTVTHGQLLGLAGHTGRTPNDRLRLEVLDAEGKLIDPMVLTAKGKRRPVVHGEPIAARQKPRFSGDVRPWARALRAARPPP